MTAEKVVQGAFRDKLDRLADRIKDDIARRDASKEAWVEATLDLCSALAEARAEFKDDQSFGKWFDAGGFRLNHMDRAAAIMMGRDLEQARQVLTATDRRSLRLICEHEFRFSSVAKPTRRKSKPKVQVSKQAQQALDAIDRRRLAGEDPSPSEVQKETGVSWGSVGKAFALREAPEPPLPDLSATAQQKIDVHKRKLEREFDLRVQLEVQKWVDEHKIPALEKRFKDIEIMLGTPRYSVMTKAEYNAILRCLHPDSFHSRTEEQVAEAFRIFTHYKLKMINDEEERAEAQRKLRSGMPRTLEEMLARKTKK